MEPGGVFPRQRDGQTAAPGELTDSATGSSYFIQWPWRPNNYERSAGSYRAMHAPAMPTGCEPTTPDDYRILRLCATDNYRRTICRSLQRARKARIQRCASTAGVSAILLNVYVSTVPNLIDNLLGFHVGTPAADVASVASQLAR